MFREIDSPLQGHPDKLRLPLMDATTGSLGQGLSIAIGHSLGKKLKNEDGTIFCILGDGELQEGQVWEALMHYPKTKMNNMICIIDWNKGQNDGYSKDFSIMYDNLEERVSSFGWTTKLLMVMIWINKRIIWTAEAINLWCYIRYCKGKGVSFMEHPSSL